MTIRSRLDRKSNPRPTHLDPCPAVFPHEASTTCENVNGHEGPHVARITVAWETEPEVPPRTTAPTP